ncbi:unnamed protein product [Polarella glacialis]|uniref:Reverse transcriptase domain-containing protein n=1 Tax=Polarella glacialis TaxID=89957 RepID=A0A813HGK7_POLGL|nr:unnamed protein product [Polarella glacialis]
MKRWKSRLPHYGIMLASGPDEKLTNMRYADDLMIYAKSWQELCHMIELLCEELANIGLHLNTSETKLFTTTSLDKPLFIDIAGGMVEVLTGTDFHKYLGRHLTGNFGIRSAAEFAHRMQCAWGKFHKHRPSLMNKRMCIKLNLKLFVCCLPLRAFRFGELAPHIVTVATTGLSAASHAAVHCWVDTL